MKGYSWFKGFRHMLGLQKKDKSLMNNAPWAGFYDRTGKIERLVNKDVSKKDKS